MSFEVTNKKNSLTSIYIEDVLILLVPMYTKGIDEVKDIQKKISKSHFLKHVVKR